MSYDNYDFCMYWEDLPEEYRKEKIDEVITKKYNSGEFDPDVSKEMDSKSLAECLESEDLRYEIL